eukprot:XP_028344215.1 prolyl endopeptidase-like isoform X2 [Physeter catodon]
MANGVQNSSTSPMSPLHICRFSTAHSRPRALHVRVVPCLLSFALHVPAFHNLFAGDTAKTYHQHASFRSTIFVGAVAAHSPQQESHSQTSKYPLARRDDNCVQTTFGLSVPDPYRWLEDPNSNETKVFINAQNLFSRPFYTTPLRQKFFQSLEDAYNYPKQGVPSRHGDRWFSWYNAGLQNQSVLHVRNSLSFDEEPRVLLDPNTWSEDGTAAVGRVKFTEDGSLLAYTRSDKGSDWSKIYFVNVEDGSHLPDVLERVKFSSLAWAPDNSGLFYNAYDVEHTQVYFHRLGTKQDEDILIVHHSEEPDWLSEARVSWDQRYLMLFVVKDCSPKDQVWIADINKVIQPLTEQKEGGTQAYDFSRLHWKKVITHFEDYYEYVTNDGPLFYFLSDKNAPRNSVVTYDMEAADGEQAWRVQVPECEHLLEWAGVVDGNKLVLQYMVDVAARLHVRDLTTGAFLGEIALQPGTVNHISGRRNFEHLLFNYESYNTPGIIYRAPVHTPAKNQTWEPETLYVTHVQGLDLSKIAVEQLFYPGKDGQRIPLFLIHKKDVALTPQTPTLLTGYGGFNNPVRPFFRVSAALATLHLGMAVAVANIRGGGEYGKEWYEAAIKTKKQVSLDDFQQAAEFLVAKKYTSADRLAIQGGSNGGFLVAACANQRPDLFKAAVVLMGVLDLTRFHKFTMGSAWKSDYGDPDKEDEFLAIMKISPLHNIRKPPHGQYPAFFLTTADHDDRVAPLHSLKFIAQLQHVFKDSSSQTNPLLIRVEEKAGHGSGKPTIMRLKEAADIFGFLGKVLDLKWQD